MKKKMQNKMPRKINNFVAKHAPKFNRAISYKKRKREQEDRDSAKRIFLATRGEYDA